MDAQCLLYWVQGTGNGGSYAALVAAMTPTEAANHLEYEIDGCTVHVDEETVEYVGEARVGLSAGVVQHAFTRN